MMKLLTLLVIVSLISGCSGTVITVKDPQFNGNGETQGVLFYGYKKAIKKVLLDRIRHPKTGDISHSMYAAKSSSHYCAPQVQQQTIVVPDYNKPYAIKYQAGLFETNSFATVLEQGMLKSVNSQSTPGVKTAVESLQGLASLREDILDGFISAEDSQAEATLNNVRGITVLATPIKCSTHQ